MKFMQKSSNRCNIFNLFRRYILKIKNNLAKHALQGKKRYKSRQPPIYSIACFSQKNWEHKLTHLENNAKRNTINFIWYVTILNSEKKSEETCLAIVENTSRRAQLNVSITTELSLRKTLTFWTLHRVHKLRRHQIKPKIIPVEIVKLTANQKS